MNFNFVCMFLLLVCVSCCAKLSKNKGLIEDGVPDLYTFTISGLRAVQTEYGVQSLQAKDASRIVSQFLDKVGRNDMIYLYMYTH